jgi:hypothetical protein
LELRDAGLLEVIDGTRIVGDGVETAGAFRTGLREDAGGFGRVEAAVGPDDTRSAGCERLELIDGLAP